MDNFNCANEIKYTWTNVKIFQISLHLILLLFTGLFFLFHIQHIHLKDLQHISATPQDNFSAAPIVIFSKNFSTFVQFKVQISAYFYFSSTCSNISFHMKNLTFILKQLQIRSISVMYLFIPSFISNPHRFWRHFEMCPAAG